MAGLLAAISTKIFGEAPPLENQVVAPPLENQVVNRSGGYAFELCDMQRLRRFLVLGSELNTYYSTAQQLTLENVECVKRLLEAGHYKEVLELIEEYSRSGRIPKEDPILIVLAICAVHPNADIRRAAYEKVNSICNIPTKLFRFLELTHDEIVAKRIANPPEPQPRIGQKRKHLNQKLSELSVEECIEENPKEECIEEKPKEPVESTESSAGHSKKKKKKGEPGPLKKVNKVSRKSLGWGRMRRHGISKFYSDGRKDACRLLYLVTKYKQRSNWSHKQVLAYAHPKVVGEHKESKNLVLKYCTRGYQKVEKELEELSRKPGVSEDLSEVIAYIKVIHEVNSLNPEKEDDEAKLLENMKKYGVRDQKKEFTTLDFGKRETVENPTYKKSSIQIVREHIPTGFLKSRKVWEALLLDMPMTAMIRNLGKMSSLNMFDDPTNIAIVVGALTEQRLQSARVHPLKILIALQVYTKGAGDKGSLTWQPNEEVRNALDAAFYKSFKSPKVGEQFKTGKKHMLCLDVSGSMTGGGCAGCPSISPAMASMAMAMVSWNIEEEVEIMAFGGHLEDMKAMLTKDMSLQQAMSKAGGICFGSTDCSLPMKYAREKRKEVDVFIVYTDSETHGGMQPMTALRRYNQEMQRHAKLIVCGMTSSGFTIADPEDNIAMDIVGFDANVPEMINDFVGGNKDLRCDVCTECKVKKAEA